jgi:hypothetical protein
MLFRDRIVFINGEAHALAHPAAGMLFRLADRRALPPPVRLDRETVRLLYQWYRAGYLTIGDP